MDVAGTVLVPGTVGYNQKFDMDAIILLHMPEFHYAIFTLKTFNLICHTAYAYTNT